MSEREGIQVKVIKNRKILQVSAWYDTYVGITPVEIPLEKLGLRLAKRGE